MLVRQNHSVNRSAFTLMEIIVVVTIILILAGAGVFVFTGVLDNARESRAKMDIKNIEKAVMVWNTRNGYYPPDLQTLVNVQTDGGAALLKEEALVDPWNQAYVYEPTNLHQLTRVPHIYSSGPPGFNKVFDNWQAK